MSDRVVALRLEEQEDRVLSHVGSASMAQGLGLAPGLAPGQGLAQGVGQEKGKNEGKNDDNHKHSSAAAGVGVGVVADTYTMSDMRVQPVGDEENQLGSLGAGTGAGIFPLPDIVLPVPAPPTLPYSCVLVDYTMPEMSGPTCVQVLRDIGFTGVIIGVTGHATDEATESFLSHGANSGT